VFARRSFAPPCSQPAAFPHAAALTIRQAMCGNAVVAMMNLAMIAAVAMPMTNRSRTAATSWSGRKMTAVRVGHVAQMMQLQMTDKDEVENVDVVAVAVVMTPPAMTVADEVAAATIRAEFRVAGRPWKDSYFPGPFDKGDNPFYFFLILRHDMKQQNFRLCRPGEFI